MILAAVTQNGWVLQYAAEEFKADKDIVLAAVTRYASVLEYAAEDLKANREIVLAAVTEYGWALKFSSEESSRQTERSYLWDLGFGLNPNN